MRNYNELRREASSKARILAALEMAGPTGCTNGDLNGISFRYGARLLELRRAGHAIASIDEGEGRWRFVLDVTPQSSTTSYLAALPEPTSTGRLF